MNLTDIKEFLFFFYIKRCPGLRMMLFFFFFLMAGSRKGPPFSVESIYKMDCDRGPPDSNRERGGVYFLLSWIKGHHTKGNGGT